MLLKLVLRQADHGPVVLPQDTCDNCVPVEEGKSWGACITGWGWGYANRTDAFGGRPGLAIGDPMDSFLGPETDTYLLL